MNMLMYSNELTCCIYIRPALKQSKCRSFIELPAANEQSSSDAHPSGSSTGGGCSFGSIM